MRVPVGEYRFTTGRVAYVFGQQRPISGSALFERGGYYNGERTTIGFNRARLNVTRRLSLEPSVSLNRITLPGERFTIKVAGTRTTYTLTPLMFVSALVQYNSSTKTVSANARFRWEYRPGSELFVVYNEERDSATPGFPDSRNRGVIVKVNRLFRM